MRGYIHDQLKLPNKTLESLRLSTLLVQIVMQMCVSQNLQVILCLTE